MTFWFWSCGRSRGRIKTPRKTTNVLAWSYGHSDFWKWPRPSSWVSSNRKWRRSIRHPRKPYHRNKYDYMTGISWRVAELWPFEIFAKCVNRPWGRSSVVNIHTSYGLSTLATKLSKTATNCCRFDRATMLPFSVTRASATICCHFGRLQTPKTATVSPFRATMLPLRARRAPLLPFSATLLLVWTCL